MKPLDDRSRFERLRGVFILLAIALRLTSAHADEPRWTRLTSDGHLKQRPAWSPDGRLLVFTRHKGTSLQLIERNVETGDERRVTDNTEVEADAAWSPDGSEIAFTLNKPQPNQSDVEVYRCRLADKSLTKVAGTEKKLSHEEYPSWSPDGKQIVFTSTRDGNQEVYVVPAAGGDWSRLTSDPALDAHPAWSPSGEWIAFATDRWGDLEIAVMRPDGSQLRRLTHSNGLDDFPAWSPDDTQLAFTSNRDGNQEIYSLAVDSGVLRRRTGNPRIDDSAAWTPDGRLTVVSQRDDGFDVYVESR